MNQIDYAEGINCPEDYDDEQMLKEFVIGDDHELFYLDTYLKEAMSNLADRIGNETIGA